MSRILNLQPVASLIDASSPAVHRSPDSLAVLSWPWVWRIATVVITFAAQGLFLTGCFDAGAVVESAVLGPLLGSLPSVLRIGICFLVSVPLFGFFRMPVRLQQLMLAARQNRLWVVCFAVQWITYALLVMASCVVFLDGALDTPIGFAWLLVWFASAIGCCASCLCAIAPSRFWARFVRDEIWVLLVSLAMSVIATCGGRIFQLLWKPLGDSTFALVAWWLSLRYKESIVSNAQLRQLGTDSFFVEIAPQCSGYEGIGLMAVFLFAFFAVFRSQLRFPQAWLLWPFGVFLIWICNSVRIAALIVIGTEYSPRVALGGFHSQAGWLLFNLVSLGLMWAALKSRFFTKHPARSTTTASRPAEPYLLPFLVITSLNMLIMALADDSTRFYPFIVIASLVMIWRSRNVLRRLDCSLSLPPVIHGIAVFGCWTVLACWEATSPVSNAAQFLDNQTLNGVLWMAFRVLGSVVMIPIIEELAFRGFLMRRLCQSDFMSAEYRNAPVWTVIVSAIAFGMLHQHFLGGVIAGLSFAWLTRQRNNLFDAIVAHAITNGLIACAVIITGAGWLW